MRERLAAGELVLALLFGAAGIFWIVGAAGRSLWQGFAPDSGFLPLVYGILLTALSVAILVNLLASTPRAEEVREPIGKPLLIIVVLTATVVGMEVIGFAPAIFVMLVALFAGLERLPLLPSLAVSAAVTVALYLIFETWLAVPLPQGPLGI
jgi:hypothetical protein